MTSQPWNGKNFVQTQKKVWTSQWLVILRTFYRQILSLLYSSFFFWNFRHRLARELLVYGCFLKWWYPQTIHGLIGFSIINHPFWGTHVFGNTHIDILYKVVSSITMQITTRAKERWYGRGWNSGAALESSQVWLLVASLSDEACNI